MMRISLSITTICLWIWLVGVSVYADTDDDKKRAIETVATSIGINKLNIKASDLKAMNNPKGNGVYVYVPKTRYRGVERYVLWLVIDGKAYALNGPTKMTTPDLPWPREAPESTWEKTGLSKYSATGDIETVFGN